MAGLAWLPNHVVAARRAAPPRGGLSNIPVTTSSSLMEPERPPTSVLRPPKTDKNQATNEAQEATGPQRTCHVFGDQFSAARAEETMGASNRPTPMAKSMIRRSGRDQKREVLAENGFAGCGTG